MKDIDFDELDKAVNSLMATTEPAASADEPTVPEVAATDNSAVPVTVGTPSPAVEPMGQLTPEPASAATPVTVVSRPAPAMPTPAARRAGRFMDMVHTSSDMKSTTPPSREGLSVTPRTQIAPDTPEPATKDVAAAPTPAPNPAPVTMPDPIDMASALADNEPMPTEPLEAAEPEMPASKPESPFIADAKVEKRPLNASETSSDETLESILNTPEPASESTSDPVDQKQADEPPIVPQIPELNSDLVAIESNEKVDTTEATQAVETAEAASQVEPPAAPLGATSIAQQYASQPSTGDQSHAAIYDATQYPEPVAHPAKKKSGWLWVIWVVLLLGVGAGGAVVLYNLGII